MDYLTDLNSPQREAVLHGDGPLLILAGAGSGKTRVITYRIAHLIRDRGVDPGSILAVTFTNKAADEMKGRVHRLLRLPHGSGGMVGGPWISTFHAACVRILRAHSERIGYPRQFVIYDETDRSSLVKTCMRDLGVDDKQYQPRAIIGRISALKNNLVDAERYGRTSSPYGFEEAVNRTYSLYEERLRESGGLDFDDLLMRAVRLFEQHPDVAAYYQNLFHHILIDEYQDTNHAQYRLMRLLTAQRQNLCVVGDDDQSIYRFRGADISNILNFEKDYPEATVIKLEQNYRSTEQILGAAGAVVSRNLGRKHKELWTQKNGGESILCYQAVDEKDEARYLCGMIQQEVDAGRSLRDIAVLYRTNAQSRAIEDAMRNRGIPYRIYGGLRFYDRKEIKDIIAYLRVLHNPLDAVSLRRIINVPARGIGETTVEKLEHAARQGGVSLYQAAMTADDTDIVASSKRKLNGFIALMERLRADAGVLTVTDVVRRVIHETGYGAALEQERTIESRIRMENLNELITATEDFQEQHQGGSLADFLDQVALITDVDQQDAVDARAGISETVTLMTLHNAKGLEFPFVFMVGMEERLFPHSRSIDSEEDLEEERRLSYVGMTRAKERLILTHATERRLYGYSQSNIVSRFVRDIPEEYLEWSGSSLSGPAARGDRSSGRRISARAGSDEPIGVGPARDERMSEDPEKRYYRGAVVKHATFGIGTVQRSDGAGDEQKISVRFPGHGVKVLAVKYANLETI